MQDDLMAGPPYRQPLFRTLGWLAHMVVADVLHMDRLTPALCPMWHLVYLLQSVVSSVTLVWEDIDPNARLIMLSLDFSCPLYCQQISAWMCLSIGPPTTSYDPCYHCTKHKYFDRPRSRELLQVKVIGRACSVPPELSPLGSSQKSSSFPIDTQPLFIALQ